MSIFHKHKWKEIARTYAGKDGGDISGTGRLVERVILGLTTILWECKECQKIKREEMLGKIV